MVADKGVNARVEAGIGVLNHDNLVMMLEVVESQTSSVQSRPVDSSPGLARGLSLRIPPDGRSGRCHGLAHGSPPKRNLSRSAGNKDCLETNAPDPGVR